jgi:hypothetical protein
MIWLVLGGIPLGAALIALFVFLYRIEPWIVWWALIATSAAVACSLAISKGVCELAGAPM